MIKVIFAVARAVAGVLGAFWFIGGVVGIVAASVDRVWGSTLAAAIGALLGFCVAYGAFVRFPWEPERSGRPTA